LEVVCHLADTDANIVHRIKRVLSEARPIFDRVQPDLMLSALAYHNRDVEEELGLFEARSCRQGEGMAELALWLSD
jgi:hypothetical protein